MFNIDKMFEFSIKAIRDFAKLHKDEQFYAFSIDSSGLCFNSEEQFTKTLQTSSKNYPDAHVNDDQVLNLEYNTGNWGYQYFADLNDGEGFDDELYSDHYHIPFENKNMNEQQLANLFSKTPYHQAMSLLLEKLNDANIFELLHKTQNFKAFLSEHDY